MANLQKQTIEIDLGGGIDTKTDSKLVDQAHLLGLDNARLVTGKTVSKRHGTTPIGPATITYPAQKMLVSETDVLAVSPPGAGVPDGANYATARVYGLNGGEWRNISNSDGSISGSTGPGALFAECNNTVRDIVRNRDTQSQPNSATIVNPNTGEYYTLFVWETSVGGIACSVMNRTTGALVINAMTIANGQTPRAVATSNGVILFGQVNGAQLNINSYDVKTGTFVFQTATVSTVVAGTPIWDLGVVGGTPFFAYNSTVAPKINLQKMTSVGVASGAAVSIAESADNALTIGVGSSTRLRLFWHSNTNGIRGIVYDTTPSVVTAVYTVAGSTVVEQLAATEVTGLGFGFNYALFAQRTAALTYNRSVEVYEAADGTGSLRFTLRSCGLASKPFPRTFSNFVLLVFDSPLQATFFLYQWWSFTGSVGGKLLPCAKLLGGVAGGLRAGIGNGSSLANLHSIDGSTKNISCAVVRKNRLVSNNGTLFSLKGVAEASFSFAEVAADWIDKKSSTVHGGALKMASGFLSSYDGVSIRENGWFVYPEGVTVVAATTGGALADGTYQIAVVYETTDSKGNVSESSPSVIVSSTITGGGGAGKLTVTYPTYRVGIGFGVSIAIYVSDANAPSVLYRATDPVALTLNNSAVDTGSFLVVISNATLISRQPLYTTGGVRANSTPDGPTVLFRVGKNIIVDDPNDATILRYSKLDTSGQELAFSDDFIIQVPADGGRVTAGIELDGKVAIFKLRSILISYGSGLSDLGQGQGFTAAQRLRADIGCLGPQLLCEIPQGVLFKSEKGIYLLGRDLSVNYAGMGVEAYNSSLIRSWVHVKDTNEVRIALDDNSTVLVYNYEILDAQGLGRWFTYSNYGQGGAAVDPNGVYNFTCIVSNATKALVYKESAAFTDNHIAAAPGIVETITTPWYKFASLQGLQRIWKAILLGTAQSSHSLLIEVGYDYETAFNEPHTITSANATGANGVYQPWIRPVRSRCQAMRLRISDPGATGESMTLSGIQFELGMLPGAMRLPMTKTT